MGQRVPAPLPISIKSEVVEVIDQFTYLGSTVSRNLSVDSEDPQAHRQGCRRFVSVEQEGVGKQSVDLEYETQGIRGMRPQYLTVRQRVLDDIR